MLIKSLSTFFPPVATSIIQICLMFKPTVIYFNGNFVEIFYTFSISFVNQNPKVSPSVVSNPIAQKQCVCKMLIKLHQLIPRCLLVLQDYMVVKHELKPPNALISQLSVLSFIITVKKMSVVSDFVNYDFLWTIQYNMMSTVINHLTLIF